MPTQGTKGQVKIKNLIQGKRILDDINVFLEELMPVVVKGAARDRIKLPPKIKLLIKSVHQVNTLIDGWLIKERFVEELRGSS